MDKVYVESMSRDGAHRSGSGYDAAIDDFESDYGGGAMDADRVLFRKNGGDEIPAVLSNAKHTKTGERNQRHYDEGESYIVDRLISLSDAHGVQEAVDGVINTMSIKPGDRVSDAQWIHIRRALVNAVSDSDKDRIGVLYYVNEQGQRNMGILVDHDSNTDRYIVTVHEEGLGCVHYKTVDPMVIRYHNKDVVIREAFPGLAPILVDDAQVVSHDSFLQGGRHYRDDMAITQLLFNGRDPRQFLDPDADNVITIVDRLWADALITDEMTDEQIARAVHAYIQNSYASGELKYISDAMHWVQTVDETGKNNGGDCEDLAILTASVLMRALAQRGSQSTVSLEMGLLDEQGHMVVRLDDMVLDVVPGGRLYKQRSEYAMTGVMMVNQQHVYRIGTQDQLVRLEQWGMASDLQSLQVVSGIPDRSDQLMDHVVFKLEETLFDSLDNDTLVPGYGIEYDEKHYIVEKIEEESDTYTITFKDEVDMTMHVRYVNGIRKVIVNGDDVVHMAIIIRNPLQNFLHRCNAEDIIEDLITLYQMFLTYSRTNFEEAAYWLTAVFEILAQIEKIWDRLNAWTSQSDHGQSDIVKPWFSKLDMNGVLSAGFSVIIRGIEANLEEKLRNAELEKSGIGKGFADIASGDGEISKQYHEDRKNAYDTALEEMHLLLSVVAQDLDQSNKALGVNQGGVVTRSSFKEKGRETVYQTLVEKDVLQKIDDETAVIAVSKEELKDKIFFLDEEEQAIALPILTQANNSKEENDHLISFGRGAHKMNFWDMVNKKEWPTSDQVDRDGPRLYVEINERVLQRRIVQPVKAHQAFNLKMGGVLGIASIVDLVNALLNGWGKGNSVKTDSMELKNRQYERHNTVEGQFINILQKKKEMMNERTDVALELEKIKYKQAIGVAKIVHDVLVVPLTLFFPGGISGPKVIMTGLILSAVNYYFETEAEHRYSKSPELVETMEDSEEDSDIDALLGKKDQRAADEVGLVGLYDQSWSESTRIMKAYNLGGDNGGDNLRWLENDEGALKVPDGSYDPRITHELMEQEQRRALFRDRWLDEALLLGMVMDALIGVSVPDQKLMAFQRVLELSEKILTELRNGIERQWGDRARKEDIDFNREQTLRAAEIELGTESVTELLGLGSFGLLRSRRFGSRLLWRRDIVYHQVLKGLASVFKRFSKLSDLLYKTSRGSLSDAHQSGKFNSKNSDYFKNKYQKEGAESDFGGMNLWAFQDLRTALFDARDRSGKVLVIGSDGDLDMIDSVAVSKLIREVMEAYSMKQLERMFRAVRSRIMEMMNHTSRDPHRAEQTMLDIELRAVRVMLDQIEKSVKMQISIDNKRTRTIHESQMAIVDGALTMLLFFGVMNSASPWLPLFAHAMAESMRRLVVTVLNRWYYDEVVDTMDKTEDELRNEHEKETTLYEEFLKKNGPDYPIKQNDRANRYYVQGDRKTDFMRNLSEFTTFSVLPTKFMVQRMQVMQHSMAKLNGYSMSVIDPTIAVQIKVQALEKQFDVYWDFLQIEAETKTERMRYRQSIKADSIGVGVNAGTMSLLKSRSPQASRIANRNWKTNIYQYHMKGTQWQAVRAGTDKIKGVIQPMLKEDGGVTLKPITNESDRQDAEKSKLHDRDKKREESIKKQEALSYADLMFLLKRQDYEINHRKSNDETNKRLDQSASQGHREAAQSILSLLRENTFPLKRQWLPQAHVITSRYVGPKWGVFLAPIGIPSAILYSILRVPWIQSGLLRVPVIAQFMLGSIVRAHEIAVPEPVFSTSERSAQAYYSRLKKWLPRRSIDRSDMEKMPTLARETKQIHAEKSGYRHLQQALMVATLTNNKELEKAVLNQVAAKGQAALVDLKKKLEAMETALNEKKMDTMMPSERKAFEHDKNTFKEMLSTENLDKCDLSTEKNPKKIIDLLVKKGELRKQLETDPFELFRHLEGAELTEPGGLTQKIDFIGGTSSFKKQVPEAERALELAAKRVRDGLIGASKQMGIFRGMVDDRDPRFIVHSDLVDLITQSRYLKPKEVQTMLAYVANYYTGKLISRKRPPGRLSEDENKWEATYDELIKQGVLRKTKTQNVAEIVMKINTRNKCFLPIEVEDFEVTCRRVLSNQNLTDEQEKGVIEWLVDRLQPKVPDKIRDILFRQTAGELLNPEHPDLQLRNLQHIIHVARWVDADKNWKENNKKFIKEMVLLAGVPGEKTELGIMAQVLVKTWLKREKENGFNETYIEALFEKSDLKPEYTELFNKIEEPIKERDRVMDWLEGGVVEKSSFTEELYDKLIKKNILIEPKESEIVRDKETLKNCLGTIGLNDTEKAYALGICNSPRKDRVEKSRFEKKEIGRVWQKLIANNILKRKNKIVSSEKDLKDRLSFLSQQEKAVALPILEEAQKNVNANKERYDKVKTYIEKPLGQFYNQLGIDPASCQKLVEHQLDPFNNEFFVKLDSVDLNEQQRQIVRDKVHNLHVKLDAYYKEKEGEKERVSDRKYRNTAIRDIRDDYQIVEPIKAIKKVVDHEGDKVSVNTVLASIQEPIKQSIPIRSRYAVVDVSPSEQDLLRICDDLDEADLKGPYAWAKYGLDRVHDQGPGSFIMQGGRLVSQNFTKNQKVFYNLLKADKGWGHSIRSLNNEDEAAILSIIKKPSQMAVVMAVLGPVEGWETIGKRFNQLMTEGFVSDALVKEKLSIGSIWTTVLVELNRTVMNHQKVMWNRGFNFYKSAAECTENRLRWFIEGANSDRETGLFHSLVQQLTKDGSNGLSINKEVVNHENQKIWDALCVGLTAYCPLELRWNNVGEDDMRAHIKPQLTSTIMERFVQDKPLVLRVMENLQASIVKKSKIESLGFNINGLQKNGIIGFIESDSTRVQFMVTDQDVLTNQLKGQIDKMVALCIKSQNNSINKPMVEKSKIESLGFNIDDLKEKGIIECIESDSTRVQFMVTDKDVLTNQLKGQIDKMVALCHNALYINTKNNSINKPIDAILEQIKVFLEEQGQSDFFEDFKAAVQSLNRHSPWWWHSNQRGANEATKQLEAMVDQLRKQGVQDHEVYSEFVWRTQMGFGGEVSRGMQIHHPLFNTIVSHLKTTADKTGFADDLEERSRTLGLPRPVLIQSIRGESRRVDNLPDEASIVTGPIRHESVGALMDTHGE